MKRRTALVLALGLLASTTGAQLFRPGAPVPGINAGGDNYIASVTGDGLRIYFSSNRPGSSEYDIYTATRPDLASAWSKPVRVIELSSAGDDVTLDVRDDDLEMVFESTRKGGGVALSNLWSARRARRSDPWGTPTPIAALNSATGTTTEMSLTGDGLEIFFTSNRDGRGMEIYRSTRRGLAASWSTPALVTEINDPRSNDYAPAISADGLTVIFTSHRGNGADFYIATRPTRSSAFSTPVRLPELSTPQWDISGQWSADGFSYYYQPALSGTIYRADRIRPLCWLDGAPEVGGRFRTVCRRDPGDVGVVAGSLYALNTPVAIPGVVGDLELHPGFFIQFAVDVLDANGRFSAPVDVPAVTALRGLRVHFQSAGQAGGRTYLSSRVTATVQ